MSAAPATLGALRTRWGIAALVGLLIAAAVGVGILYRTGNLPGFGASGSNARNGMASKIAQGFNRLETVAGMLAGRSPGERAEGALASLKHKRLPVLHERALPKIRRTAAAPSPLASIVAPPPAAAPVVPPAAGPLFNAVSAPPEAIPAVAQTTPVIFPGFTPLPGGGGGIIIPPIVEVPPPVTPPGTPPPGPPAVPEPSSWAMLLIGFAAIGWSFRRQAARSVGPNRR